MYSFIMDIFIPVIFCINCPLKKKNVWMFCFNANWNCKLFLNAAKRLCHIGPSFCGGISFLQVFAYFFNSTLESLAMSWAYVNTHDTDIYLFCVLSYRSRFPSCWDLSRPSCHQVRKPALKSTPTEWRLEVETSSTWLPLGNTLYCLFLCKTTACKVNVKGLFLLV